MFLLDLFLSLFGIFLGTCEQSRFLSWWTLLPLSTPLILKEHCFWSVPASLLAILIVFANKNILTFGKHKTVYYKDDRLAIGTYFLSLFLLNKNCLSQTLMTIFPFRSRIVQARRKYVFIL